MPYNHPLIRAHSVRKKKQTSFDKVIIAAAFAYPLTGLTQVYEVSRGNVAGVSVWSWIGFMFFSILFLTYGIIHGIKPMIIANSLWIAVDGLIVIGVLTHGVAA